jgi:hypothetical protein
LVAKGSKVWCAIVEEFSVVEKGADTESDSVGIGEAQVALPSSRNGIVVFKKCCRPQNRGVVPGGCRAAAAAFQYGQATQQGKGKERKYRVVPAQHFFFGTEKTGPSPIPPFLHTANPFFLNSCLSLPAFAEAQSTLL